ncbi:MAG: hypothetical protein GXO80_07205 [Chlorobi bacterium]|nr:hypothetical protein [Chlorobiota bacterium]
MKKLLTIAFIFSGFFLFGQARLNISSGSSVNFFFNSYQKYLTGITYNDFTKFIIYYKDTTTANSYPNWRIDVKALTPTINGDIGNTLNLNTLEIQASGAGTSTGFQALSSTDVSLLTGANETAPGTVTVSVSYRCGVTNSLLGKNSDYYVVDLLFTLIGE